MSRRHNKLEPDPHNLIIGCLKPAERGDSIKPGVERSGTPGLQTSIANGAREAYVSASGLITDDE